MTSFLLLPITSLLFFIFAFNLNQQINYPAISVSQQDAALNFKSESLSLVSLGLKRLISDIMWIQTLMDSDTDHYKKKDLNSWLYLRFSAIAGLDPKFYENYYYGSQYLMIVKDDLLGAEDLLNKGLKYYPDDVQLNWQLGFLYGIEMKQPKRALPYFDVIKLNPKRPKFFDSLYTKFSANISGNQEAFDYALEVWKKLPDGDQVKERLGKQLYTLKALIDLDCLNGGKKDCSHQDFLGNDYKKEKGHWSAPHPLINLKLKN
jgi:hypothetical protein